MTQGQAAAGVQGPLVNGPKETTGEPGITGGIDAGEVGDVYKKEEVKAEIPPQENGEKVEWPSHIA